jgi:toxin-antitoxin system PIN domain toxin
VTECLLDVNVLVGLLWRRHTLHRSAMEWFTNHASDGWATCPITQAGFVRIVSNPAIDPMAPSIPKAIDLLRVATRQKSHHRFWADDLSLTEISSGVRTRMQGLKQITDAYLLALAIGHNARFVTFDRGILSLAPQGSAEHSALVILQP